MYSPNNAGGLQLSQEQEKQRRNKAKKTAKKATNGACRTTSKPPSPSMMWSQRVLSNTYGEFACEKHSDDASIIYRWNGVFWEAYADGDGQALATDYLERNYQDKATHANACELWRYVALRLRKSQEKPCIRERGDVTIPLLNAYVRVNKDASIDVIEPDQLLGYTHAAQVNISTPIGQKHTPKKVPTDSLFYKFLSSSLPDADIRDFVQEQCAMSFMPLNYGLAIWHYGVAGAGKSKLRALLERYHSKAAVIHLHKLDSDFGLEQIVGASLLQVDEVETKKWCEATFKSLITGDPVSVNRKHKPAIPSYRNRATLMVTSNHSPFVTDNSGGVYRRLCPVFWDVSIPEEDRIPDIDCLIFDQEGDIFLDWILEGIQRLAVRGRFLPESLWPKKVRDIKEVIRLSNDHIGAWMKDCDVRCAVNAVPKNSVYDHYKKWSLEEGRTVLEPNVFWRELSKRDGFHEVNKRVQQRINGERTSVVFVEIGEDIRENAMEKLGLYDYDDLEVNNGQ